MRKLLGVPVENQTKEDILDKIKKSIENPKDFFHIVSLNPENMVILQKSRIFKEVVTKAKIRIVDGMGVFLAGRILNVPIGPRLTGVDLMSDLIKLASDRRLTVVLIGGRGNLADTLAKCYFEQFPEARFVGLEGIKNIKKPKKQEEEKIFSIIANIKPRFLFASFGSPYQEIWLWKNRQKLKGIVCMGVGGAFDYLAGKIKRPPSLVRKLGFEWLWRLVAQPWRWRRQLRLMEFVWLVFREKFRVK